MKRAIRTAALVLVVLALSACLERKESAMINPDGSGKIMIDMLVAAPAAAGGGMEKADIKAGGKQYASGLLGKSTGVDAWKDVVVETSADGRAHVAATAYFPDISKLHLDVAVPVKWSKDDKGNYTLTISKEPSSATAEAPPKMTDEEVAASVKKAQSEYKENQAIAAMILSTLKIEMTYTLPGEVTGTNILTKGERNTVTLTVDGKKMMEAMDKMMADDKALAESIRSGKSSDKNEDLMLEKLYGKKGPISATVAGPGKPLFDYKPEMEAAKAGEEAMLKKAGIDLSKKPDGLTPLPMEKAE